MLNDANKSKKWPQSEGVVTSSEIIKSSDSDGTSYRAKITYNYQVDDKTYSSNKISFGEYSSPNKNKAQDIIDKFPVGNVTVFYDPEDPARSVLEPGVAFGIYIWLFIGGGLVLIPALTFLYYRFIHK